MRMRIAVLASEFPVLSETPFLNQITGLVRRGHEVALFAERPQPGVVFHPDVDRLGLAAVARCGPRVEQHAGAGECGDFVRVEHGHRTGAHDDIARRGLRGLGGGRPPVGAAPIPR